MAGKANPRKRKRCCSLRVYLWALRHNSPPRAGRALRGALVWLLETPSHSLPSPRKSLFSSQHGLGLEFLQPQVNYKIVPWAHDDDAIPPGGVTKTRLFGLLWQLQRQSLQVRLEASMLVLERSCDGRFESVSLGSLLPEAFPPSVGPGTRAFVSSLPSLAPKLRPASVWASSIK